MEKPHKGLMSVPESYSRALKQRTLLSSAVAGAPAAAEVSKEGLGLGKAEIGRVVLSPSWSLSSLSALVFVWPFVVYRPSRKGRVV